MDGLQPIDLSAFNLNVDRKFTDEYFGLWAIRPENFQNLIGHVQSLDIQAHVAQNAALGLKPDSDYKSEGNIAQIEIVGSMMKYRSSFGAGASTIEFRRQLRHAGENTRIKTILVRLDTPGGTVAGTEDAAAEIRRARANGKNVIAFVDDMCASAGYWLASQCNKIYVNNDTALIGSIGVYSVVHDLSKQAENLGIKVHVIGSGGHKGAGTPGTEVTEAQLNEWQRLVESFNGKFKTTIVQGRSQLSATIDELADGRVHPAQVALDMKLIDGIKSFEEVVAEFQSNNTRRQPTMANNPQPAPQPTPAPVATAPVSATLAELKEICEDNNFVVAQLEAGATVAQATRAYSRMLKAENDQLKATRETELEAARVEAAQAAQKEADDAAARAEGTNAMDEEDADAEDEDDGDPVASFEALVETEMQKPRYKSMHEDQRRDRAVRQVAKKNRQLHVAYLTAWNRAPKAQRQLAEKYASESA